MQSNRSFAHILKSSAECKEPTPRPVACDGSKRISLVWFKNTDLRLHDHLPLLTAHQSSDVVIHLMVIEPFWFHVKSRLLGLGKCGPARCKFLEEAIYDLRRNLNRLGSQLIISTLCLEWRADDDGDLCEHRFDALGGGQLFDILYGPTPRR